MTVATRYEPETPIGQIGRASGWERVSSPVLLSVARRSLQYNFTSHTPNHQRSQVGGRWGRSRPQTLTNSTQRNGAEHTDTDGTKTSETVTLQENFTTLNECLCTERFH